MSRPLAVIATALLIAVVAGGCKSREARVGEYYNKANGFSVIPPAGWEQEEEASEGVFLFTLSGQVAGADEDSLAVITIGASENDGMLVLDSFAEGNVEGVAKTMDSFDVLEKTSVDIAGQPGRRILADAVTDEIPIRATVHSLVKGRRGYSINCVVFPRGAFETYLPVLEKVINSFRME